MLLDPDQCYRALRAHDTRFDGRFFVGVGTTRIYCRPVCTAKTPLRRFGTSEDVAQAALFFASDESAFITGAELAIDGGMAATL